jgi:hypothetical protein
MELDALQRVELNCQLGASGVVYILRVGGGFYLIATGN